jgi:carbonic anhydrase
MPVGDDAPVNIRASVDSDETRSCTSNCTLSFVYNPSACVVTKKNNHLLIPYDQTSYFPVKYNQLEYKAVRIEIYQPSLHKYDGTHAKAEMLVYHTSQNGGDNLIISIPLEVGNSGKHSSEIMNEILQNLPTSEGTSKSITSVNNFNLGDLIPKTGFFTYNAKHLITKNGTYTYVVYHKRDAINVARDSLTYLTDTENRSSTAIQPIKTALTTTNTLYFYNKLGANNTGDSDYYLQCDNAGYDGTILFQGATPGNEKNDTGKGVDWKAIMDSDIFNTFIGVMFGIIVALILFFVFGGIIKWWGARKETAAGENSGSSG